MTDSIGNELEVGDAVQVRLASGAYLGRVTRVQKGEFGYSVERRWHEVAVQVEVVLSQPATPRGEESVSFGPLLKINTPEGATLVNRGAQQ